MRWPKLISSQIPNFQERQPKEVWGETVTQSGPQRPVQSKRWYRGGVEGHTDPGLIPALSLSGARPWAGPFSRGHMPSNTHLCREGSKQRGTERILEGPADSKQQKETLMVWRQLSLKLLNSSSAKLKAKTKGYEFSTAGDLRDYWLKFLFWGYETMMPRAGLYILLKRYGQGRQIFIRHCLEGDSHDASGGPRLPPVFLLWNFSETELRVHHIPSPAMRLWARRLVVYNL